ncbi:MAG: proprotein convertase P-domain-containing protein [Planctomycetota bacterium]|nr:proprotein convertase P-domain-containing protein [Planctomycetota bacterium]
MKHLALPCALVLITPAMADTFCGTGSSAIPDGGANGTSWTIEVTQDGIVTNARSFITINHPWVGDLRMVLQSPDGVTVTLLDRPGMPNGGWIGPWGCGGDDINGLFTDAASVSAESMCSQVEVPVLHGNMLPTEPFSILQGHPTQGTWTMTIFDDSPVDAGTVSQVCLLLESSPDCNNNGVADSDDIANGSSQDVDGNGIPDECECPGDVTGEGVIDIEDILLVIGAFGQTGGIADIDGSGIVDIADILIVIEGWGNC